MLAKPGRYIELNSKACQGHSSSGKLMLFLFRQLTSRTENDPLVDDIITLCSVLSIAKVIRARLSWTDERKSTDSAGGDDRTHTWCPDETKLKKHDEETTPTFSWAAVGSVMIWPSLSMAQVTPQNRQLIGRPASIRVIQAAFKKHDKSCEKRQVEITQRRQFVMSQTREQRDLWKDTEPSSCNTCRTRVKEDRGWSDRSRAASQVSRTHCSCDRSLTPKRKKYKNVCWIIASQQ